MRNIGVEYPEAKKMRLYDLGSPPALEPNQVLIRTHYSGVTNGTERHALMGELGWTAFPSCHGYQHVGVIEDAGRQVDAFKPGDWVFFGRYVGHRGWNVVDIDPHGSHLILPLPDGVDRRLCALFGVAGVATRGIQRFRVAPAQKVWVAGLGPIGQFAAQAARAVGADVTVTEIDQRRLDVATELGAHRAIRAGDPGYIDGLKAAGPYDCIIDCCGLESFLIDVHENQLLAHHGVIGVLAVHGDTVFPWRMLHGLEASIEVSCHFTLDVLRVLLHFVQKDVVRIGPLVSHSVSIDEAPQIYNTLRDNRHELLGVIFDWSE
jgi:threonine dehydrogenase-like Zn-dependent dehydrogenase